MPVVDASVVFDWLVPSGGAGADSPAVRVLYRFVERGATLFAPALLDQEVGNALLSAVRRGRWSGADADDAFALLETMPITRVSTAEDVSAAWHLSRRYDEHPIYDMVYVALADRLGEPLVTADRRLMRRLARHPNPLLSPEELLG